MVTMGFPKDEITESLHKHKYNDVMATYLLLGRKAPEVSMRYYLTTSTCFIIFRNHRPPFPPQCVLSCCSLRAASL